MIRVANYNRLTIARATDNGLYLADDEGKEVLLPNRYIPQTYKIGDPIEVFIYTDSEDRLVATTETPKITEGGIAALQAVGFNYHGTFLDWGLPKDLFVPKRNQQAPMLVGEWYVVTVYVDNVTGRAVATSKLNKIINNDEITVRPKEEVDILIAVRKPKGYRVVINDRHWGMLYDNQIFTDVKLGMRMKAYVRKIADDHRIDVSLQQEGFDQVKIAAQEILKMLDEANGTLPVGDKSDPEEVRLLTGMSKKIFKRAVGYLMSRGVVANGDTTTKRIEMKNI
ncbi:CvfB family protein [Millionella massiliensis]|uniref:CvfB family protein n=1 Tax=Millionella massiliensis TaxID=1871023 RepID=UPI0024B7500F|nr:S1-like domain-containing RNA-binding protein [Millionella massiliensis]